MFGSRAVRAAVCVLIMSAAPAVAASANDGRDGDLTLGDTRTFISAVTLELQHARSIFAPRDFALDDVRRERETSLLSVPVSEPATMLLFGASLLGIARRARRS